jgi:hypothetical protein
VAAATTASTQPATATSGAADAKPADAKPADSGTASADAKKDEPKKDDKKAGTTGPGPVAAATQPDKKADAKKDEPKKDEPKKDEPKKDDKKADAPAAGGKDFDRAAAMGALGAAAGGARSCKTADGPTGSGKVKVTFAPSGNVTSVNLESGPFAGTPMVGCILGAFRGAKVPPFDGSPVSVSKSFSIN